MAYIYKTIASPVGTLKLVASGLAAILWAKRRPDGFAGGLDASAKRSGARPECRSVMLKALSNITVRSAGTN